MNTKRTKLLSMAVTFLFLMLLGAGQLFAQPTDAQIKKQVSGARTVSVTLGKPGTKSWSSTYKKYVWTRNFTAKLKTNDPEIFVIVKGYAAYDITGGRYVFWRTFTTSNSYEGIPDPSAADVEGLIAEFGVEKFMGNYFFNHVVGQVESIGLSDNPGYEWHTPNSVSLNVVAVYTERTNDVGGKERVARIFRIRLYRDSPKSAWKNLITSSYEAKKL
ncbi:MAG: hypothetical protein R2747_20170 [Pyrinomonadaceae bacterium]